MDNYGQQPYGQPGLPQQRGQQYQPQQRPQYAHGPLQPVPDQRGYPPPVHPGHRQTAGKRYALRGAESFWYVLGCISLGAAYFAKIPTKKAMCEVLSELQLDGQGPSQAYALTGAQGFWYALMCIWFGAGYFAKVYAKKALWEVVGVVQSAPGEYAAALGRALAGNPGAGRTTY
jgi:hypothetical protein